MGGSKTDEALVALQISQLVKLVQFLQYVGHSVQALLSKKYPLIHLVQTPDESHSRHSAEHTINYLILLMYFNIMML